jgi:hypothetical protein
MYESQPAVPQHAAVLSHLSTLGFQHPSVTALIETQRPFSIPSILSQKTFNAYINRLNAVLQSRDESTGERQAAWGTGRRIVEQDEEGAVIIGWGKGWIGVCLGLISVSWDGRIQALSRGSADMM